MAEDPKQSIGNAISDAMVRAVHAASLEAEEIWKSTLPLQERQAKIKAIMEPKALLERQLKARKHFNEAAAEQESKNSAIAKIAALKAALGVT